MVAHLTVQGWSSELRQFGAFIFRRDNFLSVNGFRKFFQRWEALFRAHLSEEMRRNLCASGSCPVMKSVRRLLRRPINTSATKSSILYRIPGLQPREEADSGRPKRWKFQVPALY